MYLYYIVSRCVRAPEAAARASRQQAWGSRAKQRVAICTAARTLPSFYFLYSLRMGVGQSQTSSNIYISSPFQALTQKGFGLLFMGSIEQVYYYKTINDNFICQVCLTLFDPHLRIKCWEGLRCRTTISSMMYEEILMNSISNATWTPRTHLASRCARLDQIQTHAFNKFKWNRALRALVLVLGSRMK